MKRHSHQTKTPTIPQPLPSNPDTHSITTTTSQPRHPLYHNHYQPTQTPTSSQYFFSVKSMCCCADHSPQTKTPTPFQPLPANLDTYSVAIPSLMSSQCAAMQTTMEMMCLLCCPCPQRGESPSLGGTLPCPPNVHQQSHKPWHPHQIAALPSPRHLQSGLKPTGSCPCIYASLSKDSRHCVRRSTGILTYSSLVTFRQLQATLESPNGLTHLVKSRFQLQTPAIASNIQVMQ